MNLSSEERKIIIGHRMERAYEAGSDAELLFKEGRLPASVNRIYYCMFHCLCALAVSNGFETGKHGQLIGWFNKNYVKLGIVDKRFSQILSRSFEKRMDSDYAEIPDFSNDEVTEMLKEKDDFIAMITEII